MPLRDRIITLPIPDPLKRILDRQQVFTKPMTSFAAGTITWPREWWSPEPLTRQTVDPVISVEVERYEFVDGRVPTTKPRLDTIKVGSGTIVDVLIASDTVVAEYVVAKLPHDTLLHAHVSVDEPARFTTPGGKPVSFNPSAGGSFVLSKSVPLVKGVNFVAAPIL